MLLSGLGLYRCPRLLELGRRHPKRCKSPAGQPNATNSLERTMLTVPRTIKGLCYDSMYDVRSNLVRPVPESSSSSSPISYKDHHHDSHQLVIIIITAIIIIISNNNIITIITVITFPLASPASASSPPSEPTSSSSRIMSVISFSKNTIPKPGLIRCRALWHRRVASMLWQGAEIRSLCHSCHLAVGSSGRAGYSHRGVSSRRNDVPRFALSYGRCRGFCRRVAVPSLLLLRAAAVKAAAEAVAAVESRQRSCHEAGGDNEYENNTRGRKWIMMRVVMRPMAWSGVLG